MRRLKEEIRYPTAIRVAGEFIEWWPREAQPRVLAIVQHFGFNTVEMRAIESYQTLPYDPPDRDDEEWMWRTFRILECANYVNLGLFPSMPNGRRWWSYLRIFEDWLGFEFDLEPGEVETAMIIAGQYRNTPQYWPMGIEQPIVDFVPK
ncbi:hypothetical protein NKI19_03240 [Mesorhizobium sp. M0751]|uniref:hypothetical protein n=1 Tax=unclassified Mesorhizobium TaxID=325217 RepID=UPI00333A6D6E